MRRRRGLQRKECCGLSAVMWIMSSGFFSSGLDSVILLLFHSFITKEVVVLYWISMGNGNNRRES